MIRRKSFLCLLIAIAVSIVFMAGVPNTAYAGTVDEGYKDKFYWYSGQINENIEWMLDEDGTLIICGSGALPDKSEGVDPDWTFHLNEIKAIHVEEGITGLGDFCIGICPPVTGVNNLYPNLTEIRIADSVTSIGRGCFQACDSLEKIYLGSGLKTIGKYALSFCNSLTEITVSPENKYFKVVDGVLMSYDGKTLVRYPHIEIKDVTIPQGVTTISFDAMGDLKTLKTVTVPASVTRIEYDAFDGSKNLEEIRGYINGPAQVFAKENGIVFKSIGKIPALTGKCGKNLFWEYDDGVLTISGKGKMYNYSSNMDYRPPWTAYRCLVSKIVVKEGVVSIGDEAFEEMQELTSVSLPKTLESIGYNSFSSCEKLKKIALPFKLKSINYGNFANVEAIYGFAGTEAELFAAEHGIRFIPNKTATKKANPLKVKVSKKTFKRSKLKKTKKFAIGVSKAQGKVTYKLNKKAKKAKIKVSKKGTVTIPKNCKKGTYIITVKAAGNAKYKAGSKIVKIVVK